MKDIQYIINLVSLALKCSEAKPAKISKRLTFLNTFKLEPTDPYLQKESYVKQILGACLINSIGKYGISMKYKTPVGMPHIEKMNELRRGEGDLQEYHDIFKFLETDPPVVRERPKIKGYKSKRHKKQLLPVLPQEQRHMDAIEEKAKMRIKRDADFLKWLNSTYVQRMNIKRVLTKERMVIVYKKVKEKKQISSETLSVKSNTSIHAVKALDEGKITSKYLAAKLLYYMLTEGNIDDSYYKDKPEEVFVNFLAGWKFHVRHTMLNSNHQILIDNPKACRLPLYLKK